MRFRPLLVVAGSLLGAACSGDAPSGGDVLVVSSVEVTPPSASLTVGGTLQLTAVGKTSGGVEVTDRAARWSSSNAAVASVSSSGLVTGSALGGPVTITATIDRASATASITVTPTPVATVTIEPAQAQIEVGAAVQFSATARGAQGQPLEGRPVAWESENPAIATVTTTGSAIGVTVGVTTIRATSEGKAGTATLTVVPRPATRLGFTTPPGNSVAGQPLGPVRVAVQDNIGGTVTTATTAITLGLADNPGGATLGGTLTAAAVQGVATFSDLVLNRAAAGYTLRASAAPLSPALSPPFTIVASAATALAITTQPSSAAQSGAALPQQPVVQLQDGLGNAVPQAGVTVTATLVGTGGTLSGQAAVVTNASGAAVFTNLVLSGPVGSYTLRFATAGLPEVQSNAITLGAGGAAALQIVTQPSSTAANGTPLATQPSVRLVDGGGNLVSQGGVTITASIVGGGATVSSGATATTNASGVATFSGLALTGPAGSYSLSFSGPGLTAVTSAGITLGAGPPVALSVARQPSTSAQSGVAFPVQPQVRVVDAGGNASAASGVVITAALASGAGTLGGTLTATTNASGLATFTDLAVTGPSGTYTIRFTAPGLSQVVSGVIGLGAGVATQVVITAQPAAAAQSGVALTAQPVVQIRDAANNPVPTAGVAVTAEIASGGGTLGGTVTITTNTSGIATFTDLSIAGLVGDRTLRFTSPGLASAVSGTIVLAAGPAARLALSTQPSASVVNAQPFPQQPVAQLQDASGNSVSQAGVDVTVSIATGGGVLGGTATVSTVAGGSATFTNLAITGLVGGRTLAFAATGLAGVTSGTVTVTPGPASKLGITTQPSSTAQSGVAFAQQPVVQVQDASGNAVSQASVSVTAASSGGTLGGTATVVTSASGTATFTGLSITGTPGPYTIGFTATGLTSATSSTITLGAGVASQLAMVIQPPASAQSGVIFGTAPAVQLLDATGNPVPAAGVSVTVALVGGGTLGGVLTQVTDGTGKATFPGLSITGLIGDRTLQFTASGVTAAASNTIALSAGPAARLAVAVQPAATAQSGVALSPQPQVQVQDGAGNSVSANGVAITASIASGTGGSLTGNTIAVTNASGLATFTNLTLSGTAGPFTLGFAASGLTPTASNVIALAAGAPTVLGITTQPSPSVQSGVDFPQQPVVQLQDGFSNPVAQAGVSVSVTIQSGGGTLGGTTTVSTNLSGQAVFTNLRITGVIGDRTLLFAASGYVGVSSNTVTVTAGAATALAMVTQPSASAQSGVPFPVQPSVRLVDQNGNAVSQASVSVTAAVASGGGTLGGTTTVTTDGTGLAQFTNLAITGTPGPRTLSFASTGLTGTTSASISLAAGPASQLTLTTPPPATATNGQPLAPQPAVQLRDGAGTAVAQAGVTVNAVIATSPGGTPSLAGGSAVTDVNGLATFSGLAISGTVGGYTLRFESGSLTPVTSGGITLVAGAASQLTLTTQPSANAQNTVAFPQQPVVQLRDAGGNAVSQSGVTVTASIATGTGTLGGTTAVATVNGVATFTNLSLTGTLGGFTLQFSATGLTSVTSGTITLAAGPPASLVMFRQPPSTATSGVAFPNPPTVVRVLDANGNDVNGATVTASVASGPGGASLVGSATAISGSNGQAAFNGLGILGLVGNYTLGFSTPGATGVTSTAISLSAGAAAKLALTTSPSATVRNDQAFPVQPVVQIQDLAGNPLTPNGTPITAAITSGSVTLGGTTSVNTIDGTAAFTNLKITGTTGARTLTFSSGSLTPVNSGSVNVLAGTATAIAIVTQPPASVASGATMAASVVDLRDVSGNDVDSAGVAITVAIASGGGTLDGTPSQLTGGNGQASFGDLSITGTPGNRTLSFSGTSLTAATSNAVSVTAPVATQLAITTQPAPTARSGIPLGTVPVVQARDASNNPVSGVTISVAVNGGGTPSGTTSGVTDGSGNVTFTGLTITGLAGIKSLTFSSGALPTVQSANITLGAGAATQLALTTGPGGGANGTPLSPQPVVQVRDAQGNPLDTALTVTATIATSPGGTPSLTNESASTGGGNSATFSGLTVTGQAGSYTLTFSADALTVTSGPLTLTAGSPTSMTFQTAPSGTAQSGVALGTQPAVLLTDQSGNPVNGVTVSAALLSGTGSVSGGTSAVTSSGVATFSGLVIDAQAGAVTLRFTAGGLTLDSGNIAVSAGPATQLVVTTQPVGAASGAPLNTQPVVVFRDSGNNLVNTTAAVTAVLVGAGGTLSGTTTVNAVGGIATFTNLVVAGTGTYTLRFDAGSLSIPSSSFDITP